MSAHFVLSCPGCGKVGSAELWEASGLVTHARSWGLNVSTNFDLMTPPADSNGARSFALACSACGVIAVCVETTYSNFYPGEPTMRPVAGGRDG